MEKIETDYSNHRKILPLKLISGLFKLIGRKLVMISAFILGPLLSLPWINRSFEIIRNIRSAFPERSIFYALIIYLRAAGHFAANIGEFIYFYQQPRTKIKSIITADSARVFAELQQSGKGSILITAHYGNWELIGLYFTALGYPLASLIRKLSGTPDLWVDSIRTQYGNITVPRSNSGLKLARYLKAGKIIGILADQHSVKDNLQIDFFNRPIQAPVFPFKLAEKFKVPVIPVFIKRNWFKHHLIIQPPILVHPQTFPASKALIHYHQLLENQIKSSPYQWFWFHRRWKNT